MTLCGTLDMMDSLMDILKTDFNLCLVAYRNSIRFPCLACSRPEVETVIHSGLTLRFVAFGREQKEQLDFVYSWLSSAIHITSMQMALFLALTPFGATAREDDISRSSSFFGPSPKTFPGKTEAKIWIPNDVQSPSLRNSTRSLLERIFDPSAITVETRDDFLVTEICLDFPSGGHQTRFAQTVTKLKEWFRNATIRRKSLRLEDKSAAENPTSPSQLLWPVYPLQQSTAHHEAVFELKVRSTKVETVKELLRNNLGVVMEPEEYYQDETKTHLVYSALTAEGTSKLRDVYYMMVLAWHIYSAWFNPQESPFPDER